MQFSILQKSILGLFISASLLFLAFPQKSHALIFCSAGVGQSGCATICAGHGYDEMTAGEGLNGQATGEAGWYCGPGRVTSAGGDNPEIFIGDNLIANTIEEENFYYLPSAEPKVVYISPVTSEAETLIGRVVDDFFVMMKNFYRDIFSFFSSSKTVVNGPIGEITPMKDQEGGSVGVEVLETVTTASETDLYCEIDFDMPRESQRAQLQECVDGSELSESEKEAVVNSFK